VARKVLAGSPEILTEGVWSRACRDAREVYTNNVPFFVLLGVLSIALGHFVVWWLGIIVFLGLVSVVLLSMLWDAPRRQRDEARSAVVELRGKKATKVALRESCFEWSEKMRAFHSERSKDRPSQAFGEMVKGKKTPLPLRLEQAEFDLVSREIYEEEFLPHIHQLTQGLLEIGAISDKEADQLRLTPKSMTANGRAVRLQSIGRRLKDI
jgi:hypothetical protein